MVIIRKALGVLSVKLQDTQLAIGIIRRTKLGITNTEHRTPLKTRHVKTKLAMRPCKDKTFYEACKDKTFYEACKDKTFYEAMQRQNLL